MGKRDHHYFVYIVSSRTRVLYVGITDSLYRRVEEHRSAEMPGFTEMLSSGDFQNLYLTMENVACPARSWQAPTAAPKGLISMSGQTLALDPQTAEKMLDDLEAQGKWEEAANVIKNLLAKMPADWRPIRRQQKGLAGSFWSMEEFLSFVDYQTKVDGHQSIVWVSEHSYSKLWWRLALVSRKMGLERNALICVEQGLELEPDQPYLWVQKGIIQQEMKQNVAALATFEKAATVRSWRSDKIAAWILRKQGYTLIELGRLDEARGIYQASLQLEPDNPVALRELDFIEKSKRARKEN